MDSEQHQAIAQVLSVYGLRADLPVTVLNGGTANRSYVVGDGERKFILRRRSAKYSGDEWIGYEEQYLVHIGSRDIPVPVPMPTLDGSRRCKIGSDTYQLLPYIGGQPFRPDDAGELAEAGAFLGRLHRAAEGFEPDIVKTLPRYDDPAAIAAALARVLAERGELASEERRTIEYMLACAERIRQRVPDEAYARLPHTIIHGDYHPANAAFRDGRVSALYDFDWISRQPRLRDIADLIVYFAATRRKPFDGGDIYALVQGCTFDADRTTLALQAYVQRSGVPLSQDEAAALPELMAARLLHSRVQALAKVPPERAIEVLTNDIEAPLVWLELNRDLFADRAGCLSE